MAQEYKSWQIGDVKITRLRELDTVIKPGFVIANIDVDRLAEHASWLKPHFINDDGKMLLPFQSFIIESAGKKIVLDACLGNDRKLPMGLGEIKTNFLNDLEEIVKRENVDIVMYTHFSFDHIGWSTMLVDGDWVPTFPNAKYLFVREEYEYWMSDDNGEEDGRDLLRYALQPVIDAKQYELIDHNTRINDEISLEPASGHTPGHVNVKIESKGEQAVICGDLVHNPMQIAEPSWGCRYDRNFERAVQTRREFVDRYKDTDVLVIGSHFTGPGAGYIRTKGDSFWFDCG